MSRGIGRKNKEGDTLCQEVTERARPDKDRALVKDWAPVAQDKRKECARARVKGSDREWVAVWARVVVALPQVADGVWAVADAEDNQRKEITCQRETEQDQTDKDPAQDGAEAREGPDLMGPGREESVFVRDAGKSSPISQGNRVVRSCVRNAAVR